MKLRLITLLGLLPLLPLALPAQKAETAPAPSAKQASRNQAVGSTQSPAAAGTESADTRQLYDAAKQLFDQYAPDEIKDEYEFPSHEQWEQFAQRLQQALQGGSMAELAAFEPEVRKAIAAFRMIPDYEDYADWLTERLDLIETARIAVEEPTTVKPPTAPQPKSNVVVVPVPEPRPSPETKTPPQPEPKPEAKVAAKLPYYDVWLKRLRSRPAPSRADELVPLLKVIFAAEGLPRELAWLSEVESSMNPGARSPAGARGLFQLMPETAKAMGLSLFPFDERTHPGKNAKAAARLLRKLHDRFDSWPLALAAYNAGEGKVAAALKKSQQTDFAQIADSLPVETRMYVPKFFATATVREKRNVMDLPPPGEPKLTQQETTTRRRTTAPVQVMAAE